MLKWSEPTQKSINIPSLRTLVLLVVLVAALAALAWVIVAENVAQGRAFPPPPGPDTSTAADWVSAVATTIGAALTAGALLIAASTYKHQVEEKISAAQDRRERESRERKRQAASVTVTIRPKVKEEATHLIAVRNDSDFPIRTVYLAAVDANRKAVEQDVFPSIAPGTQEGFSVPGYLVHNAWANFTDANGVRWRCWFNGDLEERMTGKVVVTQGE